MNTSPIIDGKYKEVGLIIKYEKNQTNNNQQNLGNSNSDPTNNNQNIYVDESEYNLVKRDGPIKLKFHFPPLIGLDNIGATCYMNATLQCFCHMEKFVNFFKYGDQIIELVRKDKKKLSSSFRLLIEKLWPENYNENYHIKSYAPYEFKMKISSMNKLFEGIAANDAKDLVNFIIMTLHEELNKAGKSTNNNYNNTVVDQTSQQLTLKNFTNIFTMTNQSIISDLFYAMNCSITKCGNCGVQTFNYQTSSARPGP
jgi:ubiquitin C-terminal hydrolase